ncbi:MAG: 16S rRNA (cytosine(1402)-N(4))-methyltransferase [Proteobacteria bacterium]|nr:16S rRNA (cytosine(1402)-N(4))-methyltransferase [Pseudomonadota bacterium]
MIHLEFDHKTVLLHETLQSLGDITGKTVVDCTLGGGGHTALLLHGVGRNGRVVAFDRDEDAIDHAKVKFASEILGV